MDIEITFKPSEIIGHVDVLMPGASWNGIDGLADRYALYEGDDWRDSAREYIEDSAEFGWRLVEERSDSIIASAPRRDS